MRKLFISSVIFVFIASAAGLRGQNPEDLILPLDPEVKFGILDNGLTYYIRHNEEPKNRASFYMIQNVGAILEDDTQNGLAHFLEHMAFNGTVHFPENGIINTLEKHGVAFGYNINAYTAQDETIYNLSEVPTDAPGLLDTCLLVLNDWSNYLLLTDEEIDKERGVIAEEWRTRRTADFRIYEASLPYIYNNSKYAERDVIGDLDVIKNFKYKTLRDFYHTWYRTDLQAIAVIGDFDAGEMEQKVLDLFSKIPPVENPPERNATMIRDNEEMLYALVTDKEADQSEISIYIRNYVKDPGIQNIVQLRDHYIENLFNRMTSQRISELLQKGDPPFVTGSIMRTGLARNYDITYIGVTAKTNEEALGLSKILEEVERIKQYGFTQGELDRAKLTLLNRMENRVKQKDKISNDQYASEYQNHFLQGYAFMDIEEEYKYMQALFTSITLDDFNMKIPEWFTTKNNVMVVSGPEDVSHLSEEESMAILDNVESEEIEPYEDVEVATSFIDEEIHPGSIVAEKEIPDLNAEEWTLSNGATVVYRFADYEKDNIGFMAYSPGGSSLYENDHVPSMEMLPNLVTFYGLGSFDQTTLQKMLTGKTLSLNVSLNNLSEGLSGSASPKDFETLMQLIYLKFTEPRFDEEAHKAIIQRYLAFVENMNKNPQKIMNDSLSLILSDHNPRTRIMDTRFINDVSLEQIEEVYTDRFQDASDFRFYFVGNIKKEDLKPYVEKYLASLPSEGKKENWIDLNIDEPDGVVERDIKLDLTVPKTTVVIVMNKELEYSPEHLVYMKMIQGILDLRYTETIREEEGGTYGVSTSASLSQFPDEKARLLIMFDTDPEKASYLKELIYKELNELAENGPSDKDLSKTIENMLKDREENREHNSYWMSTIHNYYLHGYNFDLPSNYTDIIKGARKKDIQQLMKSFYKDANVVDVMFSPKN